MSKLSRICRKREAQSLYKQQTPSIRYSELFFNILLSASFSRTIAVRYSLSYCFSIRALHFLSTRAACVYRQKDHKYKNSTCYNELTEKRE